MTEIHIFRHGETEWNIEGRMQGFKDSPLTELGKAQAVAARKKIEHVNFDAVFCSTSSRASDTAKILVNDVDIPIYETDELREINMGSWEGMKHSDAKEQFATDYYDFWNRPGCYRMNGAESFHDLKVRSTACIKRISQEYVGKRVLVVSHAALIKTLLTSLQSRPLDELWEGPFATNLSHSIVIGGVGSELVVKQFCDEICNEKESLND
ncbi:histidine phosphatase family protein [Grimontia sp. S25]|uniref:Histidine phosphatase family protein n=1 Tax=Grimontia sedimenti TaxID=2711294 RepID=A0A6M1RG67_9GAMM|nr:histidine phosphatase family protein [Grimontia sedimenti]